MESRGVEILNEDERRKYLEDIMARGVMHDAVEANIGFSLDPEAPQGPVYTVLDTGPVHGDIQWSVDSQN